MVCMGAASAVGAQILRRGSAGCGGQAPRRPWPRVRPPCRPAAVSVDDGEVGDLRGTAARAPACSSLQPLRAGRWPCSSGRCARAPGALGLLRDRGLEVHDPAALAQMAGGCRHRAPRRRRWPARRRSRAVSSRDHLALAPPEAGLALALEDQRDVGAGALLDLMVAVDERHAEQPRQLRGRRRSCPSPWGRSGRCWRCPAAHAARIINKAAARRRPLRRRRCNRRAGRDRCRATGSTR